MRMSNETLVVVALAAFALIYYLQTYGSKKGMSGMTNSAPAPSSTTSGGYTAISNINTSTYGMQTDYTQKPTANDSLMPKDTNSQWATMNPAGTGQLKNVDLTSFNQIGMVAQSNRNPILDIRGEDPISKMKNISPWLNSTIETTPNMNNIFKGTSGN